MINDFKIGKWTPSSRSTYIVAELSANHNEKISTAREIIHRMKDVGADAIKLQTYTPDTMTLDCDREEFLVGRGTLWEGRKLYDLYREAQTPWEWHAELFELANSLGLDCFSTPFDKSSVDFLENLNPPAYKIASFELIDLPLIEYIASKGRPIIMSTGMGSLQEISEAVEVIQNANVPLILLKCTSAYPSPPREMNLRTIPNLADTFGVPVGLSDHTLGITIPIAAVTLGASMIEKHVTLSRDMPGPDSAFSLEPNEFKMMVESIRIAEESLGCVNYKLTEKENSSRCFRRSLFAAKDIQKGEQFTPENVRAIRPGYGLKPKHLTSVLDRRAKKNIERGTPLNWGLIE